MFRRSGIQREIWLHSPTLSSHDVQDQPASRVEAGVLRPRSNYCHYSSSVRLELSCRPLCLLNQLSQSWSALRSHSFTPQLGQSCFWRLASDFVIYDLSLNQTSLVWPHFLWIEGEMFIASQDITIYWKFVALTARFKDNQYMTFLIVDNYSEPLELEILFPLYNPRVFFSTGRTWN